MTAERIATLESLPCWTWTPQADDWDNTFNQLKTWVAERVALPRQRSDDAAEASLAKWMHNQRQAKLEGLLAAARVAVLDSWSQWTWVPREDDWDNTSEQLKTWVVEQVALPRQHSDDATEASLAKWMNNQRQAKSEGLLAAARAAVLESWSEWTWAPREDQWQSFLCSLQLWLSEHDGGMPQRNSEDHIESALATWVAQQRNERQNDLLSQDRTQALEHLSCWTWHPREDQWEAWYQQALDWFFGPPCSPESPRASYPRSTKDNDLAPLSLQRLREGDDVRNFSDDLDDHVVDEHDAQQPASHHVEEASPARPLALWMLRQRRAYRYGKLPESRSLRLQQLPQWTWTRVGGEIEPQQAWAHHFQHVLEWRKAHQGRTPSESYPDSAFERRLAEWYCDNRCQFVNAMRAPTSIGGCQERVKLAPRKCKVPKRKRKGDFGALQPVLV